MRLRPLVAFAVVLLLVACSEQHPGSAPPTTNVTAQPTRPAPTTTPDHEATLAAVGDVMLARDLVTLMDTHGAVYPFERVAGLLHDADLTVANMEGAFTDRGEPLDKTYTFRTPPRFASSLARAGIDVVSLGNNHAGDFGAQGLEDTLAALDGAGVAHAGAGMDEARARRPVFLERDGLRLAFLSYSNVPGSAFAGPDMPGVARADVGAIRADVRAAGVGADVVIVSLHAGIEYTDAPQPQQQDIARAAVDAGADLVLGHHSHTLQGLEWYGAGVIAYSLGNFVFDLDRDDLANLGPRAFETVVLYVTLTADGVSGVRAEPVVIDADENRPRPADSRERRAILERIEELNAIAGGP